MAKKKVTSKILEVLDLLGIEYEIRNSEAKLKEWDSMSITLDGQFQGSWKRWSNGRYGRGYHSLVSYFVEEDLVTQEEAEKVLGTEIKGVKTTIKKVEPYDFTQMVTNPRTELIEEYLVYNRKLNGAFVKNKLIDELGVIVQDGRDNIRFLWLDINGDPIGADVQGIEYDVEKYGSRGTLKYILPGSEGFFHIESRDVGSDFTKVKTVIIFESPIDLLSYVQMFGKNHTSGTMYISLSGVDSKIPVTLERLEKDFGINLKEIEKVIVATDNDEPGDSVLEMLNDLEIPNLERSIPNGGDKVLVDGVAKVIKDWNDLIKTGNY